MNYGLRHGTVHKLTSGSSSSASSAFSANIEYIRVVGTIACHIHIAPSPTATTAYIPADDVEYIKVSEGEKIAVLRVASSDGKLTINNQQNLNPLLERNKKLYTQNDGYTASRDMRRIASVPPIILQIWTKEYNGTNNWWALPKDTQKKILRVKLNSNEFRYFKTSEGRL